MTTEQKIIADLTFHLNKPTHFSFEALHHWVIWQFPRPHQGGMMGAVHPPLPDYRWYPAIIKSDSEAVIIHAHAKEEYMSPETAVMYFNGDPAEKKPS